jgi:hypothetical protein
MRNEYCLWRFGKRLLTNESEDSAEGPAPEAAATRATAIIFEPNIRSDH